MSTETTPTIPPPLEPAGLHTSDPWGKQSACGNCGYAFKDADNFCPDCGQSNRTHKRPLRYFIREFFEDLLSLDARAFLTLRDLVLKPGKLTRRYNNDHRATYTPPLRFYVLVSLLFFLSVSWLSQSGIRLADSELSEAIAEPDSLFDGMTLTLFWGLHLEPDDFKALQRTDPLTMESIDSVLTARGKRANWLDKRTVLGLAPLLDGSFSLEQYYNKLLSNFSYSLFFFMPLMALFLKLLYIRRRQFYTEHLIYSIHLHTFSFLLILVVLWINHFQDVVNLAPPAILGIMVYMTISMKVVYGQGWLKTMMKGALVFWVYVFTVFTGFSLLLLLSLF